MLKTQTYCIAGNFHGVQFSRMVDLYYFAGLIFADSRTHIYYVLYNPTYFTGLIFVAISSAKTAEIGPREISPLYGNWFSAFKGVV